jgi:hypothetical protein
LAVAAMAQLITRQAATGSQQWSEGYLLVRGCRLAWPEITDCLCPEDSCLSARLLRAILPPVTDRHPRNPKAQTLKSVPRTVDYHHTLSSEGSEGDCLLRQARPVHTDYFFAISVVERNGSSGSSARKPASRNPHLRRRGVCRSAPRRNSPQNRMAE